MQRRRRWWRWWHHMVLDRWPKYVRYHLIRRLIRRWWRLVVVVVLGLERLLVVRMVAVVVAAVTVVLMAALGPVADVAATSTLIKRLWVRLLVMAVVRSATERLLLLQLSLPLLHCLPLMDEVIVLVHQVVQEAEPSLADVVVVVRGKVNELLVQDVFLHDELIGFAAVDGWWRWWPLVAFLGGRWWW